MKYLFLLILSTYTQDLNLFSDLKAKKVGDTVNVIIVENIKASHQSQAASSSMSDIKGSVSANIISFNPSYSLEQKGSVSSKGGGTIESASVFVGKLTAIVEELTKEGNLKISAKQLINIDGEEKMINLTGIVSPKDISSNNTVFSSNIYDLKINYESKGVIKKRQKRSILNLLLGWLF
ncbi:MAG: flagellar basal body L-ring protein FlgH [Elusimicrobiales bacterium]|nr:flagellar basal body L-ring protein FlgH [Elusimicrobiales bacterium]